MDWEAIEIAFRKKWLKEEVLSIKETAIENEPQPESTTSHTPPSAFSTPVSTQIEHTEHAEFENATHIFGNSSSSPKLTVNETSANLGGYIEFSPTPAVSELVASSSITSALETRQITADFTQNDSKTENLLILTQTTLISLSPSIPKPTNHATRVNASQPTSNKAILRPSTLCTGASSPRDSQLSASTGHEKSALLHAIFGSQLPTESLVLTSIVTHLKTRPESAGFVENRQKIEKLHIFNQRSLETPGKDTSAPQYHPIAQTNTPMFASMSQARVFFKKGIGTCSQPLTRTPVFAHFHQITYIPSCSQFLLTRFTQNRSFPTIFMTNRSPLAIFCHISG